MLKGEKITTRLGMKYTKLSDRLFYEHYQREFLNKHCQYFNFKMVYLIHNEAQPLFLHSEIFLNEISTKFCLFGYPNEI